MDSKQLTASVITVVVAVGVSWLVLSPASSPSVPSVEEIANAVQERLGASPGPDRFNPRECMDGVCVAYNRVSLTTATTTPCRIRSPQNASSTLVTGVFSLRTGTTTATLIEMAKTTNALAYATTTLLKRAAVPSLELTTLSATSTETTFGPGEWLVVKIGGAVGGVVTNLAPTGSCQAVFQEM